MLDAEYNGVSACSSCCSDRQCHDTRLTLVQLIDVLYNVITCNCSVSSSWSWRILGRCYLAWRGKLTSKLSTSDPQVADIKIYQTFKMKTHNQQNSVRRVACSPTDHQRSCLCLFWATFSHLSMYLFPHWIAVRLFLAIISPSPTWLETGSRSAAGGGGDLFVCCISVLFWQQQQQRSAGPDSVSED